MAPEHRLHTLKQALREGECIVEYRAESRVEHMSQYRIDHNHKL